jgi:hypothetical protein
MRISPADSNGAPAALAFEGDISANFFRSLAASHKRAILDAHRRAQAEARARRDEEVRQWLEAELADHEWRHLIAQAKQMAAQGGVEWMVMRFPAALCDDGGRAVNLPDPGWPETLRGKPADFFRRWRDDLKPLGFGLAARIVSFPDGLPGDVEMTLFWA